MEFLDDSVGIVTSTSHRSQILAKLLPHQVNVLSAHLATKPGNLLPVASPTLAFAAAGTQPLALEPVCCEVVAQAAQCIRCVGAKKPLVVLHAPR